MPEHLPDWEKLLAAERHLQALLPDAVLVGGTAAALHGGHRQSLDGDHVLTDLRARFDEVLAALEQVSGWTSSRILRPVLILGALHGVQTGIRQLRRVAPLETEVIQGLRVPTLPEMARIKAWLLVTRHTVRDYLDTVVLFSALGDRAALAATHQLDALYPQHSGASVRAELVERLAAAAPEDLGRVELRDYKGLRAPWNQWEHLTNRGRHFARILGAAALEVPHEPA